VEWFTKAAERGDWIAQLALGRIYFTGDGVPQDSSRARQWLFRATDSGDGVSAYLLGLLYDGRLGGLTDRAEAAKWYRQSAETGNPYAQEKLANLLMKGLGVGKDQKEAYVWLLVAVEFGNSGAASRLNSIESDLGATAAKSAREQAAELRRNILARRAKEPCSGWPGQYDLRPSPPPMSYLQVCEKK
jgi:TPR repeat protein